MLHVSVRDSRVVRSSKELDLFTNDRCGSDVTTYDSNTLASIDTVHKIQIMYRKPLSSLVARSLSSSLGVPYLRKKSEHLTDLLPRVRLDTRIEVSQ